MSWIVLFESEGRQAESIREALAEDGWQVELVSTVAAANAAVASRAAQLVIANAELSGAADVLGRFARTGSGPGSLALVAPGKKGSTHAEAADERLSRPLADNELRLTVRRMVTANRAPKLAAPADDAERLTSRDLFGDLLSEVDSEPTAPKPAAAPAPAPPATPRATAASPSLADQISGLTATEKPKTVGAKRESTASGVDDLLSKTLSGLDVGERVKRAPAPKPIEVLAKPAAAPAKPAEPVGAATVRIPIPATPEKSAPPAPAPAVATPKPEPAVKSEPAKSAPKPVEKPPEPKAEPAKPSAPVAAAPPKPEKAAAPALEATPAKKGTGPIDLSSLDALAKGKGKGKDREKTPSRTASDAQATQKISFPGATLRSGGSPNEFGEYTLLERIALGGMAEVWKARRKGVEGFQKTVAIKKILPHLTDSSDFVTMFIDEAKLAAQLNHTNIIHIYDLGKIDEDFFIAMEYVDGKDLRSILNAARDKKLPMPLGLALLVGSRLASALDYAHRKKDFEGRELGLVHRDVSPQNVLISFEGDIKLCDFGIVKAVSKASKTQMGALKGKLQYMSPEQAWGRTVDARSDIFSLGALVFEMLTGQRLFTGESEMSVLDAVREGRVQAPRDLDPRLPLEVNALVLKALAKEPKDRFPSAGDLHREIDAILGSLKPSPTQNDLALYMAKLFDVEARVPTPAAPEAKAAPAPAPAPAPKAETKPAPKVEAPARAAEPAFAPEPGRPDEALESAPAGGNKMLFIGIGAAAAVALVAWLLFGRGESAPSAPPSPAPGATESTPAPQAPAPAPSAPPAVATEKPAPPATEKPAAAPATAAVDDAAQRKEDEEKKRREDEAKRAEAAKAEAATKAAAAAVVPTPEPAPVEAPRPEPTPVPVVAPPVAAPVTRPAPAPTAVPAPKAPTVREGDLVTPGAGVKMPVLVSLNKPEYPPIARRMKVEGTVVLSLLVDENGRVVDVRLERGVSQNVGINEAATAAARTAKYQPATKDGVRVKIWHSLTIPFKL